MKSAYEDGYDDGAEKTAGEYDAELSRLRAEVERLTKRSRSAICGWCGRVEQIVSDQGEPMNDALAEMQEHERTCPKNPLVQEVFRLTAALATETRAVERLAAIVEEHLGECPEVARQWIGCPAIDDGDKCTDNCAACWSAWARKEKATDETGL